MKLWPWSEIERLRRRLDVLREDWGTVCREKAALQATVDGLSAQMERDLTAHLAIMEHFHAKIDEKDATILAMRRDGFSPPQAVEKWESEDLALPEVVADAISERGYTRQAKERLSQEARRLLKGQDADPDEVARHILAGERFTWGA